MIVSVSLKEPLQVHFNSLISHHNHPTWFSQAILNISQNIRLISSPKLFLIWVQDQCSKMIWGQIETKLLPTTNPSMEYTVLIGSIAILVTLFYFLLQPKPLKLGKNVQLNNNTSIKKKNPLLSNATQTPNTSTTTPSIDGGGELRNNNNNKRKRSTIIESKDPQPTQSDRQKVILFSTGAYCPIHRYWNHLLFEFIAIVHWITIIIRE